MQALRRDINVMAVFLVSGLWHAGLGYGVGWTFLIWGALNGFYQWVGLAMQTFWQSAGKRYPIVHDSRSLRVLRIVLTFHLILVSWIFFRATSLDQAVTVVGKIWTALPGLPRLAMTYPFTADHRIGALLIISLVAVEVLDERKPLRLRLAAAPAAIRWSVYYVGIFGLLVLGRWQASQFIYMQF